VKGWCEVDVVARKETFDLTRQKIVSLLYRLDHAQSLTAYLQCACALTSRQFSL
jgi:hypothetical protein